MNMKYYDKYRNIGALIAYYRKLQNMTQQDLAEKIDISRTHMSRIETGTSISLDTLFALSDVLDVPIGKFFEER